MTSSGDISKRTFLMALLGAGAAASGCASGATNQAQSGDVVGEYRLGPGDQLRVIVFGESELTGLFIVGSQGTISYPLVGEVHAAGVTVAEFTEQLETQLAQFVRAPNISVEVANYRPFFILGEVNRPGTYPYSANLTVQNAVATAGGFTYRANERRVMIKHANEAGEREYELTSSTPVLPGDTIRVRERRW